MIRRIVTLFGRSLIFLILTVLTQVGGIVYLLSFIPDHYINGHVLKSYKRWVVKLLIFSGLYLFCVFIAVPTLASLFGRVPLPIQGDVRPLNKLTWLLNRQYVRPELKALLLETSAAMKTQFPGISINYLDANFPFINKFPLPPHLSHNDGRKVDIAFFYTNKQLEYRNGAPSPIGYGVYEAPRSNEVNLPDVCAKKGYWQYSLIQRFVSQSSKEEYVFDASKVAALVNILCKSRVTQKVFIEPHLKIRLKLTSSKIRYHGCQAVRHDDHVHLQIN